jgi:hypothetical protein
MPLAKLGCDQPIGIFVTFHDFVINGFAEGWGSLPKSQRPSAKANPTLLGSTPRKTIQPKSLYEGGAV